MSVSPPVLFKSENGLVPDGSTVRVSVAYWKYAGREIEKKPWPYSSARGKPIFNLSGSLERLRYQSWSPHLRNDPGCHSSNRLDSYEHFKRSFDRAKGRGDKVCANLT